MDPRRIRNGQYQPQPLDHRGYGFPLWKCVSKDHQRAETWKAVGRKECDFTASHTISPTVHRWHRGMSFYMVIITFWGYFSCCARCKMSSLERLAFFTVLNCFVYNLKLENSFKAAIATFTNGNIYQSSSVTSSGDSAGFLQWIWKYDF